HRMTHEAQSEKRLERLREEAWEKGVVAGRGVDVVGGPIPRKPGYYGQPVVKPPVWTWEVPLYFFFGGIGGMSAVIAFGAVLFHHVEIARTSDFSRHAGSTPALGCWDFHFWCGNFRNFARDLYRRPHRSDGDSRVVFTSQLSADSFWNRRLGIRGRRVGIAGAPNRCTQLSRILRRRG